MSAYSEGLWVALGRDTPTIPRQSGLDVRQVQAEVRTIEF